MSNMLKINFQPFCNTRPIFFLLFPPYNWGNNVSHADERPNAKTNPRQLINFS